MKKCKKCKEDFEPKRGLINYCSLECRNSRTWSNDDKLKKSISAKNSNKVSIANKRPHDFYIKIGKIRSENLKKEVLNMEYHELSYKNLRYRILFEQDEKCNKCGLKKWLNKPLILEIEHKDGNHFNNKRENLELLCPNCHSLTLTWRGRNKQNNRKKISDEKLLESLLKNDWNMRKSLIDVGLSPKGGNYKRTHKLKKEFEIMVQ